MNKNPILRNFCLFILVAVWFSPQAVSAVTVGPVKLEYKVDPGTVIHGEFYIKNEEESTKTFYPSYEKFTEPNSSKIFSKELSTISLWVKTASSVILKTGEDQKVPFTITVPKDAPPGGHFAVVWWSTTPPVSEKSEQVSIVTRAGILVYLNVSGEVTGTATISDFSTQGKKKLFWTNPMPLILSLHIKNDMNIYVKPQGEARITSLFGNVRSTTLVNAKNYQILPGSLRTIDGITLQNDGFMFGPYKVEADVVFDAEGKVGDKKISFWIWVLPWKLLVTIIVLLLLLVIGGPFFLKRYNRWVIQQARKSGGV